MTTLPSSTHTGDFFERQDHARRKTKILVVYLMLAVGLTIAAIYLAVALILQVPKTHRRLQVEREFVSVTPSLERLWNPQLFAGVSLITGLVILGGSLHRLNELRQGGASLASKLGGRRIHPQTSDPDERKLLNIVEEMAIASGIPVPEVYVLDGEEGINAFAAGNTTGDAVIGVTRGGVRLLNRDELQGVIAHEFSHILNGDMRLNLRLIGIVFGLLCLVLAGRVLLHSQGSGRKNNPLPLIGLVLILAGLIGAFFARLIKSAVARQREFLADSAAVQFTRNPSGLANALKKIGGLSQGSHLNSASAEEASHLFFGNALAGHWFQLLSTHPPLDERIRILDPTFNGEYPAVAVDSSDRITANEPPGLASVQASPVIGLAPAPAGQGISPARVMAQIGTMDTGHLIYAANLVTRLPNELRQAAREPFSATAMIYALMLSRDEPVRAAQLQELEMRALPSIYQETLRLFPHLDPSGRQARLPLVELALPALRNLSAPQYERFSEILQILMEADQQIDLFEYTLQKMLQRHLEPFIRGARKQITQYYVLKPLEPDVVVLLSALAHLGQTDLTDATAAFRLGLAQLQIEPSSSVLLPLESCNLSEIDAALNRLAQAIPPLKKRVLEACAQTIAADGIIQDPEAELLRAIADTLDCPMPPMISSALSESHE
jgi:Zn-dependent protease with chaperone function